MQNDGKFSLILRRGMYEQHYSLALVIGAVPAAARHDREGACHAVTGPLPIGHVQIRPAANHPQLVFPVFRRPQLAALQRQIKALAGCSIGPVCLPLLIHGELAVCIVLQPRSAHQVLQICCKGLAAGTACAAVFCVYAMETDAQLCKPEQTPQPPSAFWHVAAFEAHDTRA